MIDRCIVIPDWEGEVTDRMMYIKPDYTNEIGIQTVKINHVDGAGMVLPHADIVPVHLLGKNFMFRGPTFKGLLSSFDYIEFCRVHNVKPEIKDYWGLNHDLIAENIQVLFTASQFKLCKLYNSWQEYKDAYKRCGCQFGITQFEEDEFPDKNFNYQMMQTLEDFTDEEIKKFTADAHKKLIDLAKDKDAMLKTLKAKESSYMYDKVALHIYPELLRDGYSRKQLKDTKKRMLQDAKSGAIRCANKRLFALPDWYAACEAYFLGAERPVGLLKKDEIACRPYAFKHDRADVLRSPHLYMEHAIRKIVADPNVYKWLNTDGVYTSCHDMITRILQLDVDGDQLNVVVDPTIIAAAERNIKKYDVIPLFYDANKAAPEQISKAAQFHGLKRAHLFSNIGEISNMLTRLWNRDKPDRMAAALLCYLNNLRIDGAKTGMVNEYTNYPEIAKQINKATGGPNGRMPFFFQFSKNGRRDQEPGKAKKQMAKINNSTMNRICKVFDDIGNINMNWAGIPPFNWQMLLDGPCYDSRPDIVTTYCSLNNIKLSTMIVEAEMSPADRELFKNNGIIEEHITHVMTEKFGSMDKCYPYIAKYLFSGENLAKATHKQTFWRVFGEKAVSILKKNLESYTICGHCGAKVPLWAEHSCPKNSQGFYICIDCGTLCQRTNSKQIRCANCQKDARIMAKRIARQRSKEEKKERDEISTSFLPSQNNAM